MRYFSVFSGGSQWIGSQELDRGEPEIDKEWTFRDCYRVVQLMGQDKYGGIQLQFLPVAPVWAKNAARPRLLVDGWYELDPKEYDAALTSVRASRAGIQVAR